MKTQNNADACILCNDLSGYNKASIYTQWYPFTIVEILSTNRQLITLVHNYVSSYSTRSCIKHDFMGGFNEALF